MFQNLYDPSILAFKVPPQALATPAAQNPAEEWEPPPFRAEPLPEGLIADEV
jgi:hypothetical protein